MLVEPQTPPPPAQARLQPAAEGRSRAGWTGNRATAIAPGTHDTTAHAVGRYPWLDRRGAGCLSAYSNSTATRRIQVPAARETPSHVEQRSPFDQCRQ